MSCCRSLGIPTYPREPAWPQEPSLSVPEHAPPSLTPSAAAPLQHLSDHTALPAGFTLCLHRWPVSGPKAVTAGQLWESKALPRPMTSLSQQGAPTTPVPGSGLARLCRKQEVRFLPQVSPQADLQGEYDPCMVWAGIQPPSGWMWDPWGSGRPNGLLEKDPALPLCKGPWYLVDTEASHSRVTWELCTEQGPRSRTPSLQVSWSPGSGGVCCFCSQPPSWDPWGCQATSFPASVRLQQTTEGGGMRADTCVFCSRGAGWAGQAMGSDRLELCLSRSVRAQVECLPPQGSLHPAPRLHLIEPGPPRVSRILRFYLQFTAWRGN